MGNAQSGNTFILKTPSDSSIKIQDAVPADSDFDTIAGFQSNSLDFAQSIIDVTNKSSSENMQILADHGIKSLTISGSGFLQDESLSRDIEDSVLNQELRWFQAERDDGRKFTAKFKISSYTNEGSYDGAINFSVTLNSSGAITVS